MKVTHPYVNGTGERRPHEWISNEPCLICNEFGDRENGYYGVLAIPGMQNSNTIMVECLNCGNTEPRHRITFTYEHPPQEEEEEDAVHD